MRELHVSTSFFIHWHIDCTTSGQRLLKYTCWLCYNSNNTNKVHSFVVRLR